MKFKTARTTIASTYLGFFLALASCSVVPLIRGEIYVDDLSALLYSLVLAFSIPLAIIAAGIYAGHTVHRTQVPRFPFWSVLVLSLLWNGLLSWRIVVFCFGSADDSVSDLVDYVNNTASKSSFLISAGLSFLFAKGT